MCPDYLCKENFSSVKAITQEYLLLTALPYVSWLEHDVSQKSDVHLNPFNGTSSSAPTSFVPRPWLELLWTLQCTITSIFASWPPEQLLQICLMWLMASDPGHCSGRHQLAQKGALKGEDRCSAEKILHVVRSSGDIPQGIVPKLHWRN